MAIQSWDMFDIKGMLGFLVENIYVVFGDQFFPQSIGITMDTN